MSLRSEVIRIFNELMGQGKKITQLPAGTAPTGTELIEAVQGGQSVSLTVNQVSSGGVGVISVVAGTNVTVDDTDPQNPIVSASGGGGTTEHVDKTASFTVSTADTKKIYVMTSGSPIVVTLPDLSAETTDFEWAFYVAGAGGGSFDPNGESSNNTAGNNDFSDQFSFMYLYYDHVGNIYYIQNGSAGGATPGIDDVLAEAQALTDDRDLTIGDNVYRETADNGSTSSQVQIDPSAVGFTHNAVSGSAVVNADDTGITVTDTIVNRGLQGQADYSPNIQANDFTQKNYVDAAAALKVAIAGDTMSGNLAMGSNKVTGLAAGTAAGDAVRFEQVIGVQDLFIPAAAMWPRATNGCENLTRHEMATSLVSIQSLDFDQTTQEFAEIQLVFPRKYNLGTVTAIPYWTASAGSGTVQWGISGGAYSNDDALTVALGTAQTSDDTLIATNDLHIGPETSAITLAGTPASADFIVIRVSRNPASDTLSGDAFLLGIVLRITTTSAIDG